MAIFPSQLSALVKALAVHSQNARKVHKNMATCASQVQLAYNGLETDRLKILAGDEPNASIEKHMERIKAAEASFPIKVPMDAFKREEGDAKDPLRNLWTATVRLRDAMAAEAAPTVADVQSAPSEASTESEL
ncbi:hypothetical protein E8E11_009746 [Didymella keratinophila]|nr:hypothetical protein E8E11_009746 [Didymella keratinophila]